VMMPEFVDIYDRLGRDYDVPILLPKDLQGFTPMTYAGPARTGRYDAVVQKARALGEPVFDAVIETPWNRTGDAASAYRAMFASIPEGLSYLALHFNAPGEFEAIEPALAHIRIEEYAFFRTGEIEALIAEHQLEVIGMRQIRDQLRALRARR